MRKFLRAVDLVLLVADAALLAISVKNHLDEAKANRTAANEQQDTVAKDAV